jgi:hypothetical protein
VEELPFEYYSIKKEVIKDTFKLRNLKREIIMINPEGFGSNFLTDYGEINIEVNNQDCVILTKISFIVNNLLSVDDKCSELKIGNDYHLELIRQPSDLFKRPNIMFNLSYSGIKENGEKISYMKDGIFKVPVYLCTNVITIWSKSDSKLHYFIKEEEQ